MFIRRRATGFAVRVSATTQFSDWFEHHQDFNARENGSANPNGAHVATLQSRELFPPDFAGFTRGLDSPLRPGRRSVHNCSNDEHNDREVDPGL